MVDVDDFISVIADEIVGENLHVPGEDDKFDLVLGQQLQLRPLLFLLVVAVDRKEMEIDAELAGHRFKIGVIADNQGDFHIDLFGFPSRQDIVEAVGQLGDEDGHPGGLVGEVQLPFHAVFLGDQGGEILVDLVVGDDEIFQFPLDAHEKDLTQGVNMLIQKGDVAVVLVNKLTDRGHDAFVVGAMDEQDGGGWSGLGGLGVHGEGRRLG